MRWGVDGNVGVLADMEELGIWEPLSVKEQTFKTAIEVSTDRLFCSVVTPACSLQTAVLLLRIDDIVSGSKKGEAKGSAEAGGAPMPPMAE